METPTVSRAKRVRHAILTGIKRFVMFLFSHVGLTSAVVAYSMLGGVIFKGLEAPSERIQRDRVEKARVTYTKKLVELSQALKNTTESYAMWQQNATKLVEKFQMEVFELTAFSGWDGQEPEDELQWSFPGALLYAITVVTTIGYGHITPKTSWGRIVTIVYAIVGIPLTFLCLRNIGSLLSSCVKLVYKHACLGLMSRWLLLKRRMRKSRRLSKIREAAERARKWSRQMNGGTAEACGENVKTDHNSELLAEDENKQPVESESREITCYETEGELSPLDEEPVHTKLTEVRVPVSITLFIMTGYIIGGAIMFALWEKDWDFLIASYFCFITLSTIGFGDYVPGSSIDSWGSQEKLVMCCLYLLFGMAMQAMCFHLMQEEVRYKFRKLAKRVGLLEEEEKTGEEAVSE
ncbi:potassium channel subfamily K member 1-like [Haliotis rufescens]|uniref:potassium channel subfamily K member 1-like n=1 Tax=Haliotis rufescens TaxID=6454 RepID=UPI00201F80B0|nr:potassium channel subfamily K member 1-like [Haliotis rufescens]